MRLIRTLTSLAVTVALLGLAGCGSDNKEPGTSGDTDTSSTAPGEEPSDSEDTSTSDVCTALTDDEISGLVGGAVTRQEVPGGGCTFNQEDPRAVSVSFATSPYDEGNGGFEGATVGVSGVLEGPAGEDVPGVGDQAFVKTGTAMGGSNTQGGGIVLVGDALVQVTLLQGEELAADQVKDLVVEALTLAAGKL